MFQYLPFQIRTFLHFASFCFSGHNVFRAQIGSVSQSSFIARGKKMQTSGTVHEKLNLLPVATFTAIVQIYLTMNEITGQKMSVIDPRRSC